MSENEAEVKKQPDLKKRAIFLGNVGILFSGFAVIVLIIAMGLSSYGLLAVNSRIASVLTYLFAGFAQSQNAVADARKTVADLQQLVQQNSAEIKNQAQVIAELQKSQHTNKDDFLAAEAHYWVKLANNSLQFENDIPLAVKLLQSADQNIATLKDPGAYTVREALAADLVALQSAKQVDVSGIYARLSALNDQLEKLPIMNTFTRQQPEAAVDKNSENLPWWRRGLTAMGQALQHIVIIRKNQPNIPPFITPDQQVLLYQNLHAELEKAEWGLLHSQQEVYGKSLQRAVDWIKRYTVQNSPVTQQVLTDLQQLQQIDVHPAVPTVTNTLQAFQTYLNNR